VIGNSGTGVDVKTGMIAAARLRALLESRAGRRAFAGIIVKSNRVVAAVRSTMPRSMWGEITRKLEDGHKPLNRSRGKRMKSSSRTMILRAGAVDEPGRRPRTTKSKRYLFSTRC
jgi:hypothetical protein